MPERTARICLKGYSDADAIEQVFGCALVDVAYVDEITPQGIFVIPDVSINLNDPKDYQWVKSIITETLERHHHHGVSIELERPIRQAHNE